MSSYANFRRFNTSNSADYNSNATYEEGTLTWDNSNGLRVHDGETAGGDPLLSVHSPNNIQSPVVDTDGINSFAVPGNVTNSGWAYVGNETLYFTNDQYETGYVVTAASYDSGSDTTTINVAPNFNIAPIPNSSSVYTYVQKSDVRRLIAGDGIELSENDPRWITVQKSFAGVQTIVLTDTTVTEGISAAIQSASIFIEADAGLTAPGPQYLALPVGDLTIPAGTAISIINDTSIQVDLDGWGMGPGGSFPLSAGMTVNLVLRDNGIEIMGPRYTWWIISVFSWM